MTSDAVVVEGTLARSLLAAQKKLPAVPKNATADVPTKNGGKYSYSYVTLDSLIAKTLPILNEHGIAITQAPEYIEGFGLGLRTTLTHASGETVSSVMPIMHAGHSMQDLGGAITYARRYAWASVLGIASEHDDDAGHVTNEQRPADPHGFKESRADYVPTPGDPGAVMLTFGKHKDKPIRDVPAEYLQWWIGQDAPKTDDLRRQRAAAEMFLSGAGDFVDIDSDVPF